MIHPAAELRFVNPDIGYGVFAREPISKGTILWVLCDLDLIFTPAEAAAFPPPYQPILERYAYSDAEGRVILCWDHGRYLNHSCEPTMVGVGSTFEIAVRDVAAGEEITCEYASLNLPQPMDCRCGAGGCRRVIASEDLPKLSHDLDRQVEAALPRARAVPQPLLAFAKDVDRFWAWVDGREPVPSCRTFLAPTRRAPRTPAALSATATQALIGK
jgi:hypothetical protein